MSVVKNSQSTEPVQASLAEEAFRTITFDNSFDSELEQVEYHSSFEEAEWDPVGFDLTKSKNPDWKESNNQNRRPRRIQDIRLSRLDSGTSCEEEVDRPNNPTTYEDEDDNWPYEEPGSPCALFGNKTNMSSSPADGFEGEFSGGDPEWDNQDAQSKRSTGSRDRHRSSHNNHRKYASRESSSRRLMQSQKQQQQQQQQQEEDDGSDHSAGSYELETASQSQSEEEEGSYSDESERSATDSPTYDDDNLMVTPAMGKTREAQRKKPPTLKRGAHQVATPSIVKAMKDKQAFTVSDEDDNNSIDFDAEFDSDLESGSSAHSRKSKGGENGSRKGRSDSRYEAAANNSFRRASVSKKNFKFDRSMSSADMKAARKANNSFKGHSDLNRSFSALSESKRRMNRTNSRRSEKMQASFSSSSRGMHMSGRRLSTEKSPQGGETRATRKIPSRAKSMGHPTAGTTKLKSALSKFSGSADEPPSAGGASGKKSYGSTLSALKVLSGADGGGGGGGDSKGGGEDLKSAIMQQVYRSTSMNPIEVKRAPKPKITKTNSLSASGMARAAAASGEFPPNDAASKESKESKHGRVRRSKTANERSNSDFANGSYHESIAKMRKQKMADASERSEKSSRAKEEKEHKESSSSRANVGRAKSFSYSSNRSGTNLDMQKSDSAENSPERAPSGSRPRMKRGSSKRLQSAQDGEAELTPSSSRRSVQKSGSRRSLQKERVYDASPQRPSGTNVITLLRENEPVTDSQMMQKGNRQMFHALMFKTKMGIDMDELRRTVEGGDDEDDEASASDASR